MISELDPPLAAVFPSLENQLEAAYAAVATANEPGLAGITPTLSTLLLAQAPQPTDDGSNNDEGGAQLAVPYVLLTAKRGDASVHNFQGQAIVSEMEFIIEVADNAQPASANGGALDALFSAAVRPLSYVGLPSLLTAAVSNFKCFGQPARSYSTSMEGAGSIVKRVLSTAFFCVTAVP